MDLIYQNFDGLDISFQGIVHSSVLSKLADAKKKAQEQRKEALAEIGSPPIKVLVAESGAMGGYLYRFDTGIDGEVWFISQSQSLSGWNIRVSVKSLSLALYGYHGVKERILAKLMQLKAYGTNMKKGQLLERVSRVDYCFDFSTLTDFSPDPCLFISHQHCKKACYGEQENVNLFHSATGSNINTVRVGSMPGRQVAFYNKTLEIKSRAKQYWWEVWGINKEGFNGTIWRIEPRAGKIELDKWGIKRFADFEEKIGDVILNILEKIRYAEISNDQNRSRWPNAPFWDTAIQHTRHALKPHISNANRENIIRDYRENIKARLKTHILGTSVSYAVADNKDISEFPTIFEDFLTDLKNLSEHEKENLIQKFQQTHERYLFLD